MTKQNPDKTVGNRLLWIVCITFSFAPALMLLGLLSIGYAPGRYDSETPGEIVTYVVGGVVPILSLLVLNLAVRKKPSEIMGNAFWVSFLWIIYFIVFVIKYSYIHKDMWHGTL